MTQFESRSSATTAWAHPASSVFIDVSSTTSLVRGPSGGRVRALVVEADPASTGAATSLLTQRGFVVSAATDAPSALRELSHDSYHVVLVDAGSHSTSGSEICRAIRDVADIPICLVSPSDDEIDVVLALELGADAFMLKPVRPHELVARLLALVRRTSPRSATAGAISAGDVEIDPDLHEVRVRGELVDLTVKEFSLLSLLLAHAGRALTREFLVDRIWGTADRGTFKTLSSHVHRLREIIEPDPDNPSRLLTIRGYGYRFIPTV